MKTRFGKVRPRGEVAVYYTILPGRIEVTVDLGGLNKRFCREILVLNEQGSSFFRVYSDSSGLKLVDHRIGAWDEVHASEASLSSLDGGILFTLRKVDGATLFRGWERVRGSISWAGLSYSIGISRPVFSYTIYLGGGR